MVREKIPKRQEKDMGFYCVTQGKLIFLKKSQGNSKEFYMAA